MSPAEAAETSAGPPPAARRRGTLALIPDKCTSCMICVRECPDWCIHIESHTETIPAPTPRGRARTVAVLDEFVIDMGHCQHCGICVEVCPFDALAWVAQAAPAEASTAALRHDRERLAGLLPQPPRGTEGATAGNTAWEARR